MAYSAITKPSLHFDSYIYTPASGGGHTNTSLGFQPDLVWYKQRNGTEDHGLYDSVRGVTKRIISNSNGAETTEASGLTAFNSDGWVTGADGKSGTASQNYVSWNWKAGNSAGSSNSNGSVTSTVSVNTTSKFSIVKYTNPSSGSPFTVGHGLGVKPTMIIFKQYSATSNWSVWHQRIGFSKYLVLNSQNAEASANLVTATTTDTFSQYHDHHNSGQTIIAYCFADIPGYSKADYYMGQGNTNGQFINCGFKPNLVMVKRSIGGSEDWNVWDRNRIGYNAAGRDKVYWNLTSAESTTGEEIDFCATGFKWRTTNGGLNGNDVEYVFYAIAEHPFVANVGSNGVPATAE